MRSNAQFADASLSTVSQNSSTESLAATASNAADRAAMALNDYDAEGLLPQRLMTRLTWRDLSPILDKTAYPAKAFLARATRERQR